MHKIAKNIIRDASIIRKRNKMKELARTGDFDPAQSLIYNKANFRCDVSKLLSYYPSEEFSTGVQKKSRRRLIKTAAVCFNSDLQNFQDCGRKIDACDIVIRINFQPTEGFETQVGGRTTVRLLGREWIYQDSSELLVHSYNNAEYAESDLRNLQRSEKLRKFGIYVTRDSYIQGIYQPLLGGMMSNGFRAVLIALSLSERVKIFGADIRNYSILRFFHKSQQAAAHFPGPEHLSLIKDKLSGWEIEQDFEWYFEPLEARKGHLYRPHNTIPLEYAFYFGNPRVFFDW